MTIPSLSPVELEPVYALPSIDLPQLQQEAAFLTRVDSKYIVPMDTLGELLATVEPGTRALQIDGRRTFGYTTRYFDDDHTAYYRALRKRPDRFKVRTRLYDESGDCQLEVKLLDDRGRTVKSRFAHDADGLEQLSELDSAWLRSFEPVRSLVGNLEPSIATHYRRSTLVFPGGSGRMTIDQELTFIGPAGEWRRLEGYGVIEVKRSGRPLPFDRMLWSAGYRPAPVSKFALGVCLSDPCLPANRWHRLRQRLEPSLRAGVAMAA